MTADHQRFHAPRLRNEEIAPGPGELIVYLREAIQIEGRHAELAEPVRLWLQPGAILHAEVDLASVRDAVGQHLSGTSIRSEVRFGVAVLLGLEPAMRNMTPLSPGHERQIDDWLDRHAAFAFQMRDAEDSPVLGAAPVGLFNGMMRSWQLDWALAPARQ